MDCAFCDAQRASIRPSSMTAYAPTERCPYPNPYPVLCDECWAEYVEYWNEMWAEYRNSQGF